MTPAQALMTAVDRIRARQSAPVHHAPVTLPPPMQFADLDQTARCAARRRALDARAEGQRLADLISAKCGADDAQIAAVRAGIVAAMDMRLADNARRDVAQVYREAAE